MNSPIIPTNGVTSEIAAQILNEFYQEAPVAAWSWFKETYEVPSGAESSLIEHPTISCVFAPDFIFPDGSKGTGFMTVSPLALLNAMLLTSGQNVVIAVWSDYEDNPLEPAGHAPVKGTTIRNAKVFTGFAVASDDQMREMGYRRT